MPAFPAICSILFLRTPTVAARNKIAAAGLDAAKKSKPAAFMDPSLARLVTVGNFEDDLKKLADVDWIIEAVVENLEIKRALLQKGGSDPQAGNDRHDQYQRLARRQDRRRILRRLPPGLVRHALLQSAALHAVAGNHSDAGGGSRRDRRHLSLLRRAIWARASCIAKDTPNFIGNRIGTFSVLNVMRLMQEMDLTIEEVDALTGQAVGWPKSATFRTIDLVGLDILGHVVGNMTTNVHDERSDLRLPEFFGQMLQKKWLGDKTKGGFYKKAKGGDGKEDERLALDWKTLEYHPRQKPKFPALDMAKNIEDTGARLRMLLGLDGSGPQKGDKAGAFLWAALSDLWTYSANRVPEISDSIVEIDRAMRLGFNWELGPFELWDAAGVEATVARMKKEGKPVAANVEKLLASGQEVLVHRRSETRQRDASIGKLATESWEPVQVPAGRVVGDGRKEIERRGEEEFRSLAGRSRRRRGLHRVPQQDELAGRRHHRFDYCRR